MKQFLKITFILTIASAMMFSVLLLIFGDVFIGFFIDASQIDLFNTSKGFIAILWPVFIFNGLNIIISGYLTSIHQPTASAIVSISRALIFPLSLLYVFTQLLPDIPFLLAVTLGEALALIIAVYLFWKHRPARAFKDATPIPCGN